MKKSILLFPIMISLVASGQTDRELDYFKVGFFAGPQMTSVNFQIRNIKQPAIPKYGYQLGVMLKRGWDEHLWFTPELFYSLKGYDVRFRDGFRAYPPDSTATGNNTSIHSLELGLLMVQYDISPSFFIKTGLSLDIQWKGHEKYYSTESNSIVERPMTFNFYDHGYAGLNWNSRVGWQNDKLIVFLQYGHGIGNLSNHDGATRIYHRVYGISIGRFL